MKYFYILFKNQRKWQISFLFYILYLMSCSATQSNKDELLSKNVDFLIKKGNDLWERRSNSENSKWARHFLGKAHKLRVNAKNTGLLYSKACFFEGRYIEKNNHKKDSLFLEGAQTALSYLVNLNSKELKSDFFLNIKNKKNDLLKVIEQSNIQSISALYLLGLNMGEYIFSKPVRERMEHKNMLEILFLKIYSIDASYDFGGPLRLLGIYYSRIPGMDITQSKLYFNKAIKLFPSCFIHRTSKAEYYNIKLGQRENFTIELNKIIRQDPTTIPDIMPENLMEQERAQYFIDNKSNYFE